jgi:hypothetical protein
MDDLASSKGIPAMAPPRPEGAILRWRRAQLVVAGYDELSAHRAAADPQVDIHAKITEQEQASS